MTKTQNDSHRIKQRKRQEKLTPSPKRISFCGRQFAKNNKTPFGRYSRTKRSTWSQRFTKSSVQDLCWVDKCPNGLFWIHFASIKYWNNSKQWNARQISNQSTIPCSFIIFCWMSCALAQMTGNCLQMSTDTFRFKFMAGGAQHCERVRNINA